MLVAYHRLGYVVPSPWDSIPQPKTLPVFGVGPARSEKDHMLYQHRVTRRMVGERMHGRAPRDKNKIGGKWVRAAERSQRDITICISTTPNEGSDGNAFHFRGGFALLHRCGIG